MQERNDSKISNGQEILDQIKAMRSDYESRSEDVVKEEESFLDRLNRLVQLILNDDSASIYPALNQDSLKEWKKGKFKRWLKKTITSNYKNTFYFAFLVSITAFLVSEAATFYADGQTPDAKVYIKAILTEVAFIFLSGYKTSDWLSKVWVNALRAGVFSLMLFVISSQTLLSGTQFQGNTSAITQQVQILEDQIAAKEKTIQFYTDKGWGNSVRKQTEEKDKLVTKLLELKEKQAAGSNEAVSQQIVYRSYGQAFFRVILLFISVLITRRIFVF